MRLLSSLAALTCGCLAASAAATRPNEIVVSAANYAETSPEVLARMFRNPDDLPDPQPPPAATARVPRYYQFLPGERYESDVPYLEVCRQLKPALATKGLLNTTEEAKVEYVLRISFGGRAWRDPLVRKDDLEWRHGLVPRRRGTSLGASAAWDDRAGGDESALRQTEQTLTEMYPGSDAEGMADRLIGGMPTEDYYLVVVDAFAVADLRAKGNRATRAWSTFIAVPRQPDRKFSELLGPMIAKAAPYFGETIMGKARFTDRQGRVEIGEARVVEEAVPYPPTKK
jgi:hypothetical protein